MRILSFTAGAAHMYCGSCLRDNTLAAELKAQGHDVILVPLYTPTRTDEPNVSDSHIFFGGIGLYLKQHYALFRALPRAVDKLWDARWALRWAAKQQVPTSPDLLGALTVSMLEGERGFHASEIAKLLDWLRHEPKPDVISLPYTLLIALARPLQEALGRPVACALQGEDFFLDGLREPWRGRALDLIRDNLRYVDAFLPVSHYYAGYMQRYLGIPAEKMRVVPIGINVAGLEPGWKLHTNCFTVGYFARIAPEKSLHLLCEAYHLLRRDTDFSGATLEAGGYLAPEHRGYLAGIEKKMRAASLGQEFAYRGALDRLQKIEFLRNLDVLSVPSHYPEPKGLYALEAMAAGVPVVEPRHGAFPELLAATGGGVLFEPDDVHSLADRIYSLWRDRKGAEALGQAGAAGVRQHYTAERMARRAAEVFAEMAG